MGHMSEQASANEPAAIREALAAGRLSVADPESGFQHSMYAACPHDGTHAEVRRIVRGGRGAITQVMARCPVCGAEFVATPEELHLR